MAAGTGRICVNSTLLAEAASRRLQAWTRTRRPGNRQYVQVLTTGHQFRLSSLQDIEFPALPLASEEAKCPNKANDSGLAGLFAGEDAAGKRHSQIMRAGSSLTYTIYRYPSTYPCMRARHAKLLSKFIFKTRFNPNDQLRLCQAASLTTRNTRKVVAL